MPQPIPPSVNFHFWQPCNMRCGFCFATFKDVTNSVLPKGHLPREAAIRVTQILAESFEKISFAGGEPTLCPWLVELIGAAKRKGATTSLISNGSRLDDAMLQALSPVLDWIAISVDSSQPETHKELGRSLNGKPLPTEHYVRMAERIRQMGFRLKINTTVNALNATENMSEFILSLRPERWKVMQVLPVAGQNDQSVDKLLIDKEAFDGFVSRHSGLKKDEIVIASEDNEAMTGSYAMVGPAGRFFDDTKGRHTYSKPILEVGIDNAWNEITFLPDRFENRGGMYDWKSPQPHTTTSMPFIASHEVRHTETPVSVVPSVLKSSGFSLKSNDRSPL